MKNNMLLLLACIIYTTAGANTNDSTTVSAALKNVTVYKIGAEMTHTTNAFLKQGNNELVIDDISNQLDINSIQIKTGAAVTVMGIEFTNNYLKDVEASPRVKYLKDSLAQLQKMVDANDLLISNDSDLLDLLSRNKDIKGTQTGLSVAALMQLMDYYKKKSLELETAIAKLTDKNIKVFADADKIQAQVDEEELKNTSTAGRLIVQLSASVAGKEDFTISYITQNASWEPSYDIRVDDIKDPMKIIYKAKILQTTGIDWKQVKLSLSTALPSQWNNAPELQPWFAAYVDPEIVNIGYGTLKKLPQEDVATILQGRAEGIDVVGDKSYSNQIIIHGENSLNQISPLYVVDGQIMSEKESKEINPGDIKSIKVLRDAAETNVYGAAGAGGVILITLKNGLDDYVSVNDNTLDVTFDVDLPYDVPTNGKPQTAILQTMNVPATYKDLATPKLDKDPYLLAQVVDWGKLNLLPGEANIIVDNTYIGKSTIDPGATSDTLNMTLGRDKRVVVTREKITDYSSVKFLGSNKLQKFTYGITVRNTKKDAVDFLLNDQYPVSTDKDIVVELTDNGKADVNTDTGLLSWKLNLAPGETRKIRFAYTIKYPKDREIK
jgi:TonB-dependent SusC/RagA subfamily outer membrane receptor